MPFKVRFRGFTLVELLVVLVIFLIVGTILFYLLIKALKWVSTTGGEVKQELSTEINTDLLVFDLKHAGYGISKNETKLVISYCNGTINPGNSACKLIQDIENVKGENFITEDKLLLIKETSNIVRSPNTYPTLGFVYAGKYYPGPKNPPSTKCVWLNFQRYLNSPEKACNSTNDTNVIGFPIDENATCQSNTKPYCCSKQPCTYIAYFLHKPQKFPKKCFEDTYVLYRKIPYKNVAFTENKHWKRIYFIPIINCVSDWDVWFGFDTDNDTKVDSWTNNISSYNNTQLKKQLKIVKIFILVQASSTPDPNYDFCQMANVTCTEGSTFISIKTSTGRDIELQHPDNEMWKHYRWKIIEITVTGFPNIP